MKKLLLISALFLVGCASTPYKQPLFVAPTTQAVHAKIVDAKNSVNAAVKTNTATQSDIADAKLLGLSLKQKLELLKKAQIKK